MRTVGLLLTCSALLAGCGSSSSDGDGVVVSAATSLKAALSKSAPSGARLAFAGSDMLAAQIRQGVRPDVFASANTKLPAALYAAHLVERPVAFATNELVLAVPAGGEVRLLADAARPGRTIAEGAATVPVGSYTRDVLDRLDPALARALTRNVRSREPDVGGVVGKLAEDAVDAGFVYVTDVTASNGRLRAIRLPAAAKPRAVYAAAVVRGAKHRAAVVRYVRSLVSGAPSRALRRAGFGAAP